MMPKRIEEINAEIVRTKRNIEDLEAGMNNLSGEITCQKNRLATLKEERRKLRAQLEKESRSHDAKAEDKPDGRG